MILTLRSFLRTTSISSPESTERLRKSQSQPRPLLLRRKPLLLRPRSRSLELLKLETILMSRLERNHQLRKKRRVPRRKGLRTQTESQEEKHQRSQRMRTMRASS